MTPLHADPWFSFRFAGDRLIPRFRLEGVPPGVPVCVFRLDPSSGVRLGLLASAATGADGWVGLPVPLIVRAGTAFAALPVERPAGQTSTPAAGPIRSVLFDLDGTLVDSRPGIVAGLRHALGELGHALPADEPL